MPIGSRLGLLLLAVVVAGSWVASTGNVAGGANSATGVGAVRTLVSIEVPISSFAQDGRRLAWMTGSCRDYYSGKRVDAVVVRAAAGGPSHALAHVCGLNDGDARTGVVLSGTRVLFWWPVEGGNFTYHRFATAALENNQVRIVGVFGVMSDWYLSAAGGEGGPFVQAAAELDPVNDCYSDPIPCIYTSTGQVSRVQSSKLVRIPSAPAPAALDASGSTVAIAPAATRWGENAARGSQSQIPAALNGLVQVRNILTGALRGTFAPRGRVLDLALAGNVAATLVATGSAVRVERYSVRSGRRTGSSDVPHSARDIDVAGSNVVYRVGNAIYRFSAGRPTLVARALAPPIGLSVVGRRIAWAENVGGRGQIKAVTLPT